MHLGVTEMAFSSVTFLIFDAKFAKKVTLRDENTYQKVTHRLSLFPLMTNTATSAGEKERCSDIDTQRVVYFCTHTHTHTHTHCERERERVSENKHNTKTLTLRSISSAKSSDLSLSLFTTPLRCNINSSHFSLSLCNCVILAVFNVLRVVPAALPSFKLPNSDSLPAAVLVALEIRARKRPNTHTK